MSARLPVAILASGRGSNFRALVDAAHEGDLPVDVQLLVSDRPGCGAVAQARELGVPVFLAPRRDYPSREAMDDAIGGALAEAGVELVVLAGYMRLIGPALVRAWRGRMINVHPSLLPKYPGLHALDQALAAGERVLGATVHLVDEGVDSGPILAQRSFEPSAGASREEIEAALHRVEHALLREVVGAFATGRVRIPDGGEVVRPGEGEAR